MVAKLAVWGSTRLEAIDRLARALDEYTVTGITTTLPFFRDVVRDEEFIAAKLDTGFIPRFNERQAAKENTSTSLVETDLAMIAAALHFARSQQRRITPVAVKSSRWKFSGRKASLNSNTFGDRAQKRPKR
jgi:propionyl-CoA carboxylase alpha chain